ncbi:MAG: KEOPS complex kinase/ATPase Bud32 [Candidatus Aenigmarchaeota archaeon]|nr:KEOPS complex kinase/ATPase Bud32 [Candidatus Aenigmarchaeota archaeon]
MSHDITKEKIIQRGAEAILYLRDGELVKERVAKGYRIPQIDVKIRKQRTRAEAKLMERARASNVSVPRVRTEDDFRLVMEYVKGTKLKDALNSMDAEARRKTCEEVGALVAGLHIAGIIHGDLTTSNMILSGSDGRVYLIDFGLGKFSLSAEDRAVDLFLLYEALKSTHFAVLDECWESVLAAYADCFTASKDVLARMETIKKRRRYK